MLDEPTLSEFLAERWGVLATDLRSHHGGMNSATWFVRTRETTWVAKAVPPVRASRFEAGLAVAPERPGHGIEFDWKGLDAVRAS